MAALAAGLIGVGAGLLPGTASAGLILEPQHAAAPPAGPERDPSASEALYARTHRSQACLKAGSVAGWLETPSSGPLARMSLAARDAIVSFYRARDDRPAWACADGSLQRAVAIGDAFADAWRHGLEPGFYFDDHMRSLLAAKGQEDLAELDVHLTASLLLYASHVTRGRRVPDRDQAEGFLPGLLDDRVAMLERLAAAPDLRTAIAGLMPSDPAYERMRRTLALYRSIARNGGWPRVPEDGDMLEPGDRDARVAALRLRLKVSGDLDAVADLPLFVPDDPEGMEAEGPVGGAATSQWGGSGLTDSRAASRISETAQPEARSAATEQARSPEVALEPAAPDPFDPDVYGRRLELAVRHFQARHGLTVDGIVGPGTLGQLNVTAAQRADQIALNMERVRWRTARPARRIDVNIPAFHLEVLEESRPVLDMKVIVGRTVRQTPLIAGQLRYLVLNPFWNVPRLIARKDIARAMQRDPGYVSERGIRVLTGWGDTARYVDPRHVDWSAARRGTFPYRLRQDPGPRNSLGRIKFMMPNPHAIYLHDTPDRHLFGKDRRSFSSGCIRVEDPMALAIHLLAGAEDAKDNPWDRDRIEAEIATGRNRSVALPKSMPVFLDYITAWVDEDGHTVQFREDLYRRDHPLAVALAEATPAPKQTQLSAR